MNVSEIAATATGNQDLFPDLLRALEHGHAPPTLARFDGAHEPRRARSQNHRVEFFAYRPMIVSRRSVITRSSPL